MNRMRVTPLLMLSHATWTRPSASAPIAGLKSSPVGRDCLKIAEAYLAENGWANAATLAEWRNTTVQKVEEAVAQVQREPGPDAYHEEWCALASKHLTDRFEQ